MSVTDDMVCFGVYSASHAFTQAYRRVLAPWKLTYPQYLAVVSLADRGPRSVKELGEELFLDSGTLSPLLRRLENRGLVSRERARSDDRIVEISLTDDGRALRRELDVVGPEIARCTGLTGEKARVLLDAIHDLNRTIRQGNEASAS
ncbi:MULTISPECIES: MarR family winged helix-turn-helix transcriptional regulator [unclassified Microbacterium]|uniref:MarR family winged helix-turn-helix transcriptional regulator n=1 Tax=unclassified Microbacterium TaxID=2609290 RepID=UPI003870543F